MISSTRSSESASRSSWNDASSVMSASSIPSCSVTTSLTRSKTASLDAAMSPHLPGAGENEPTNSNGAKSRRSYNSRWLGHACTDAADHVVLDAAGREPDRVGDRRAGRVAVRDNREPSQAEQIRAAVGVRVEAPAEPPGGRADQ